MVQVFDIPNTQSQSLNSRLPLSQPFRDSPRQRLIRDLRLILKAAEQYGQRLDATTIGADNDGDLPGYTQAIRQLLHQLERDEG